MSGNRMNDWGERFYVFKRTFKTMHALSCLVLPLALAFVIALNFCIDDHEGKYSIEIENF